MPRPEAAVWHWFAVLTGQELKKMFECLIRKCILHV